MPVTWNTANVQPAPCMPCGSTVPIPAVCSCALLIPPLATAYANYSTAANVVADMLQVASCIAYFDNSIIPSVTPNTSTATDSGTAITLGQTFPSPVGNTGYMWVSISASAGDVLTFTFSSDETPGPSNFEVIIYACDGTMIETIDGNTGSSYPSSALPYSGEYWIKTYILCSII